MNYTAAAQQLRSMREEREQMRGDWLCAAMDCFVASDRTEFVIPDGCYRVSRPVPMKAGHLFGHGARIHAVDPAESCFSIAHENANGPIRLHVCVSHDNHPSYVAAVVIHPPK